jgi:hypothetical protein
MIGAAVERKLAVGPIKLPHRLSTRTVKRVPTCHETSPAADLHVQVPDVGRGKQRPIQGAVTWPAVAD